MSEDEVKKGDAPTEDAPAVDTPVESAEEQKVEEAPAEQETPATPAETPAKAPAAPAEGATPKAEAPPSAPAKPPAGRKDSIPGARQQRRDQKRRRTPEIDLSSWVPKTELGRLVSTGKVTSLSQALDTGLPIRESAIVDILLPDLEDDVLNINMVQRMTDSGRRVKFSITTVVGNRDGYIGLGRAKGKEVGPTIRKAIEEAKMNIIEIKRGCGSWGCGCGTPHSLPFAVSGKSGSTVIWLKPAPRGVGIAAGNVGSRMLALAGYEDIWSFTKGQTRTTVNFAQAVFDALITMTQTKVGPGLEKELNICSGMTGGV